MAKKKVTQKTELKPCPFCGGRAYIGSWDFYAWFVECGKYKCPVIPQTREYKRESDAIKAWNRRASDGT